MGQAARLPLLPPGDLHALEPPGTEPALESLPADLHAKLSPLTKKNGLKEAAFVKELEKTLTPEELAPHKDALLKNAAREKGDGGGLDTMSQLLLAGVTGADDDRTSAFLAATRARLRELQQPDGSWKAGGQLPRMNRSEAEGTELTTMWTVLALSEGPEVTRALTFLKDAKPGKTNEGLALRLMLAKKFGEGDAFAALAKELIGRQNPDGSWAWLQGGTGDAFATGQVLYALGVTGAADPAAVQRARAYLLGTQTADGSWTVPPPALTSPSTAPDRLKRLEPIYRYWGSAWAAIGLARTLPAKS
ncbi:MAG: hypothetical protein HY293_13380 [Planctomycetes bacterium]|nr:hypothetical protein [Planctomycetota bacterium]